MVEVAEDYVSNNKYAAEQALRRFKSESIVADRLAVDWEASNDGIPNKIVEGKFTDRKFNILVMEMEEHLDTLLNDRSLSIKRNKAQYDYVPVIDNNADSGVSLEAVERVSVVNRRDSIANVNIRVDKYKWDTGTRMQDTDELQKITNIYLYKDKLEDKAFLEVKIETPGGLEINNFVKENSEWSLSQVNFEEATRLDVVSEDKELLADADSFNHEFERNGEIITLDQDMKAVLTGLASERNSELDYSNVKYIANKDLKINLEGNKVYPGEYYINVDEDIINRADELVVVGDEHDNPNNWYLRGNDANGSFLTSVFWKKYNKNNALPWRD